MFVADAVFLEEIMLSLCARDIMTRDVLVIYKDDTIEEALAKMADNKVSGLPVVDTDGCLQGIITESDVLLKGQYLSSDEYAMPNSLFAPRPGGVLEAQRRAQARIVEEAMTKRVLTFMEDSLVVDIARAMIEHAINRVPIVDGCRIMGIISRKDVVKALAKESKAIGGYDQNDLKTGKIIEL